MKEEPYILSGRNTVIHKHRKVDLLIINSRQDPVLIVMHNGIEEFTGVVPKNKLEAKRMDVAIFEVASPDNFADYKSLLFVQTLNNKEFKIDYSKKGTKYFIVTHQESTFNARVVSNVGQFLVGLLFLSSLFLVADYVLTHLQISTPPALLGIAVLFTGFVLTKCVPKSIELAAKPLLTHMSLFFIPIIVAIVNFTDLISAFPLAMLLSIVVSTIISLAITALISQRLMYMLNPTESKVASATESTGKAK